MNRKGELGMKKIVPFKKEIAFKTNVSEITSISLEHNLHIENSNLITGNFTISGEYKIADTSINTDLFSFELPFDINVDDKYDLTSVNVDIDDFYYEIINSKSLEVHIDVLIDKLVEKPLIEEYEENENSDLLSTDIDDEDAKNDADERVIQDGQIFNEEATGDDDKLIERCIEPEDILNNLSDNENHETKIEQVITNEVKQSNEIIEKKEIKSMEKINSLFDNLDASSETYKTYKVCIIRTGDTIESVLQKYSISKEELENYNNLSDIKIGDKLIIPSVNDEKV